MVNKKDPMGTPSWSWSEKTVITSNKTLDDDELLDVIDSVYRMTDIPDDEVRIPVSPHDDDENTTSVDDNNGTHDSERESQDDVHGEEEDGDSDSNTVHDSSNTMRKQSWVWSDNQYRKGDILIKNGKWYRITGISSIESDNDEDIPCIISFIAVSFYFMCPSMSDSDVQFTFRCVTAFIAVVLAFTAFIRMSHMTFSRTVSIDVSPMTTGEVDEILDNEVVYHAIKTKKRFALHDGTRVFIPDNTVLNMFKKALKREAFRGFGESTGPSSYGNPYPEQKPDMKTAQPTMKEDDGAKQNDCPDADVRTMIDRYLNELARVGVNSNTGDNMDLIADYWDEVANGVPDDDILEYSAEFLEPMRALGDVVGLYVRMLKAKRGFYSKDDIESARRALNESEENMLTLLRKAGRRMTENSRSKAESSVDYLKLKTSEAFG